MKVRNLLLCSLAGLVCAGFAYLGSPAEASARSAGAVLGQARFGSQASCFYEATGGPVQWYCGGAPSWVIPIVYDNNGNTTIRVSARGSNEGTHNVSCRAYSATSSGGLTVGSESHTIRNDGATEYLTPSVYAHGYGGAWVTCTMEQGTRLFNIHH